MKKEELQDLNFAKRVVARAIRMPLLFLGKGGDGKGRKKKGI